MTSVSTIDPIIWIEDNAAAYPDSVWLSEADGAAICYGELLRRTASMAGALADIGVLPGARVALCAGKSSDAIILYFACLYAGAVLLPLNPGYTPGELAYFIEDAEPVLFVGTSDGWQPDGVRFTTLADLTESVAPPVTCRTRFPADALAAILYTSGTTGRSKGAMLTRGNLASNAATLVDAWAITRDDVLIHMLPIFHVHGLFVAVNTLTAAGGQIRLFPKFDPEVAIGYFADSTLMMGVPTFYTRLLESPQLDREACASMRLFVSGSAPLLAETHNIFSARTGHAILERYGMTETGMNTSNPYAGARVAGTVGPPIAGVSIRIVDPDTANPCATDAIGMIEVKGPNVFAGYWQMPEKTAAEFREGWFVTGDLGKIDSNGYVHIVGRGKDLIISGGFNVYPKEVEEALDALPGVLESAVVGIADQDLGEVPVAIVVPESGVGIDPEALQDALKQSLAAYKRPRAIHSVEALPRNAMGKVQKGLLRSQFGTMP